MTTSTAHFQKPVLTFGEQLDPAMKITEQADADQYLSAYVRWLVEYGAMTEDYAQNVALGNIGYFAGYYSAETAERVLRLFDASHPIFGKSIPFEDSQS